MVSLNAYSVYKQYLFCRPRWLSRMRARLLIRWSQTRSPPGPATFFRRDWSWNIFFGHSLPSADSRRAVVSFWRKNVHKYTLTAQRTKLAQEKCSWVNWPARHDLNSVDWAVNQTNQAVFFFQHFIQNCMCAKQRIWSACASAQSDQSLRRAL